MASPSHKMRQFHFNWCGCNKPVRTGRKAERNGPAGLLSGRTKRNKSLFLRRDWHWSLMCGWCGVRLLEIRAANANGKSISQVQWSHKEQIQCWRNICNARGGIYVMARRSSLGASVQRLIFERTGVRAMVHFSNLDRVLRKIVCVAIVACSNLQRRRLTILRTQAGLRETPCQEVEKRFL